MRKIVTGAFVSLDGVMQAPGGAEEDKANGFQHGGWVAPHFDEAGGAKIDELLSEPYDLLLGRKTYDIFAGYWPHHTDVPIGAAFDRVTKYVATRNPGFKADWKNSEVLSGDVVAALRKLKQGDGPKLVTQGSTDLLKTLLSNGLVDELTVMIFPVILGKGKRLFDETASATGLTLIDSTTTPAGVTINRYVLGGEVQTAEAG
jgi:dihydrofolate reductase